MDIKETWQVIRKTLSDMVGRDLPDNDHNPPAFVAKDTSNVGYSQFNEILLILGLNRVSKEFFQFLVDGTTEFKRGSSLDLNLLNDGVDRVRKLSLLVFGNTRFGFKQFSEDFTSNIESLESWVGGIQRIEEERFTERHSPVLEIREIPIGKTFMLGYLTAREIKQRLEADPSDSEAKNLYEERSLLVATAIHNQRAYLASDHMDVYVATSMRNKHEFFLTNSFMKDLFGHEDLNYLNLRV